MSSRIMQEEQFARELLKLMGVNYDELIRMDERSPYARAVQANPALLDQVRQASSPVLAALRVAMGFKPYAEFMDRYGSEPDSIREAIRQEVQAEMQQQPKPQPAQAQAADAPFAGTPFANGRGAGSAASRLAGEGKRPELAELFGR